MTLLEFSGAGALRSNAGLPATLVEDGAIIMGILCVEYPRLAHLYGEFSASMARFIIFCQ